jgi:hypothetical protein
MVGFADEMTDLTDSEFACPDPLLPPARGVGQ